MKYAAVIFDLDGTLMNTLGGISDALNYAAAKQSISPFTDDKVKSMIGNGIRKLIDRAFDSLDEKVKNVRTQILPLVTKLRQKSYPGRMTEQMIF